MNREAYHALKWLGIYLQNNDILFVLYSRVCSSHGANESLTWVAMYAVGFRYPEM